MHFLLLLWVALLPFPPLKQQPGIVQEATFPAIDCITDRALWCGIPGEALYALMAYISIGAAV